ncbi:MAG: hypothetical protein C0499_03845 [Zymomonas sp.]|nr:hypothetical protein [Zymomonas sp.]
MPPPHRLIQCPDLRAIAQAERLGELGAAVGLEAGVVAGAGDGDIGGGGIDGVGAGTLQMRHGPRLQQAGPHCYELAGLFEH